MIDLSKLSVDDILREFQNNSCKLGYMILHEKDFTQTDISDLRENINQIKQEIKRRCGNERT